MIRLGLIGTVYPIPHTLDIQVLLASAGAQEMHGKRLLNETIRKTVLQVNRIDKGKNEKWVKRSEKKKRGPNN
jgi:hypothetical protein